MTSLIAAQAKILRILAGLSCPLLLALSGCEQVSPQILQEFGVDVARGALAAGLL